MFTRTKDLVGAMTDDPVYLRRRARVFRDRAGDGGDGIIRDELLRLAALYEEIAADADIGSQHCEP